MPNVHLRLFASFAAAIILLAPVLGVASPAEFILAADNDVVVREAWARASAGTSTTGAAYVTLMGGDQPDALVAVSTPIAATADVHETINDNGIMKMRPVPAVPVPPGKTVTFIPGGNHIMLMGLKQKLTAGQSFPLTLTFAHAPPVTVNVKVRDLKSGGTGADRSTSTRGDDMDSHGAMPAH